MTPISKTQGTSDPALMSQVETPDRPVANIPDSRQAAETSETVDTAKVSRTREDGQKGPKPADKLTYEQIEAVAGKLQKRINDLASEPHSVAIHQDKETKEFVIKIKNPDGEVVKQFPSEKVLNLHRRMDDLSGMVIDEMI